MQGTLKRYSQLKEGSIFTFDSDIVSNPIHLCQRTAVGFDYFDSNGETLLIKSKDRPLGDPIVIEITFSGL